MKNALPVVGGHLGIASHPDVEEHSHDSHTVYIPCYGSSFWNLVAIMLKG
jgi:hypothetical protein